MSKVSEEEIMKFWTDNPMVHPGFDFDYRNSTPEEICDHEARMIRVKTPHFHKRNMPLLSRFIEYELLRGKDVMDVGFGVGWMIKELYNAGANVYGIDLSQSHYELCRNLFKNQPEIELKLASAENIPYPDERFDFVVSYGVIHHAANDIACFNEVYRILKPGAKAFIMLYRKGGPKYWYHKVFRRGILKGEIFKHRFNLNKFIYSVTDAYFGAGAPISRHYKKSEIQNIFSRYTELKIQISGNAYEWGQLPSSRFPITNLLGEKYLLWLGEKSGAYWLINITK